MTRDRVLRAAIRLADEGGIEEVSMRKLAQELGVEAMSLYHHVSNKDDVLDGIADLVVARIELPEIGGDWKKAMRQRAHSAHDVLLRHPWASMLIPSRLNIGPAMLRYVNATLGCLREAGFSYQLADRAWNALDSHIYGFTLQELRFPLDRAEYCTSSGSRPTPRPSIPRRLTSREFPRYGSCIYPAQRVDCRQWLTCFP